MIISDTQNRSGKTGILVILCAMSFGCRESYEADPVWPPEQHAEVIAEEMMIAAAHPLAVEAGLSVLQSGGNAVDAAVTVQMVLNVVEPPESGIGGGGFLLYRDGASGKLAVYDGREVAPMSARADRFMVGHWPLPLWGAVPTGLAVGVPGLLAMLHRAHSEHGTQPWQSLFDPAIDLAEEGIPMPRRLKRQIDSDPSLWLFRDTRTHFVHPRRQEEPLLQNAALAGTLRDIAREGPELFYNGELARNMIRAANNRWPGRGDLALDDFALYSPLKRDAICRDYRRWSICGLPAPSSGGITLLQILGILEHFDLPAYEPGDPMAIHLIAEASRLAFADRAAYIGDPDFVSVPQDELLDSAYLTGRAAWIDTLQAMDEVSPGIPRNAYVPNRTNIPAPASDPLVYEQATSGTTHFSIADQYGNTVAMTSSIESPFGSRIMTDGFLLNNQLTDFTFLADQNGYPSPNSVEPGKRPRSSMAPVMVFDEQGDLLLVIGSRGGSRIIGYVVKTLIGVLDWDLSLQNAIAMPNFLHTGRFLELEKGTAWADREAVLRTMGHQVRVRPLESGIHGIERVALAGEKSTLEEMLPDEGRSIRLAADPDGSLQKLRLYWRGGADPRMEGVAAGI